MISQLEGVLIEKAPHEAVLDVRGVGYELRIPLSTFVELPDIGKTVRVRVHTHVREEALHLYGFWSQGERTAFRVLIAINGIGPRLALGILSSIPAAGLAQAVRAGDRDGLRAIPGVGPKMAERMLIELRDKLDRFDTEPAASFDDVEAAAVSALMNLDYPRAQAEKLVRSAVERLGATPALEELAREALRVAAR